MVARRLVVVLSVACAALAVPAWGAVSVAPASGGAALEAGPDGGYPPCSEPHDPDTACTLSPTQTDSALGRTGPPVYGRPAYARERGEEGWTACPPAERGMRAWNGCDPFDDPATRFHFVKPYGTPEDAVDLVLWEPGRLERGSQERMRYYQSDEWVGPVSWNDGYYIGTRYDADGNTHYCGGMYYQDVRYGPDQTPAPGFADHQGYGGQGCL